MTVYLVYVRDRITDPEEFRKYEESSGAASAGHPVTPLPSTAQLKHSKVRQ